MRDSLKELIEKTIAFEYELPHIEKDIPRTIFSNHNDHCYTTTDDNALVEIIYNSIIEYSFNEFELEKNSYQNLHVLALKQKLKYNESATPLAKSKYGFYGEVLLYSLLHIIYNTKTLIARGYFYNPLEKSETKGYDSYHLIESGDKVELWFGEVKFHKNYKKAIKSVMENINKAISDEYLEQNLLSIHGQKKNLNLQGTKIETIWEKWDKQPSFTLMSFISEHDVQLVYPVLLIYEGGDEGYDEKIKKISQHIEATYSPQSFGISIKYKLFFILIPIENVKQVKQETIKCIESKTPLLS